MTGPGEVVIRETHDDAFQKSAWEGLLSAHGVRSPVVCGLMPERCVQATARTAVALGHRAVPPHDAHATHDIPVEPGVSAAVPAATVARGTAWPLSRDAGVTSRAADVTFTDALPADA
ncbi:isochorismatase family protein [Streptomyces sp. NPDC056796]|uniref:isochorismatase family protein n=1 Tax=Streptomyces sp. NPDC056796 TaxID=3345947 RepID=UPI003699C517